jgi:hypothetical protein
MGFKKNLGRIARGAKRVAGMQRGAVKAGRDIYAPIGEGIKKGAREGRKIAVGKGKDLFKKW